MASSRIRRTVNLGGGWKQVVYLTPIEYGLFNLFIVAPFYLTISIVKGTLWLLYWQFKLPYLIVKFIYKQIKSLITNLYNRYKTKHQWKSYF